MFEPKLVETIWGGRGLETLFNKPLPPGKLIGESWEIYDGNAVINGPLAGRTLAEITASYGKQLLGSRVEENARFPLLVKLSTTEMDLSIQVHPDDAYAREKESGSGYSGKMETVYILDTKPGSRVYLGFKEQVDKITLEKQLKTSTVNEILQEVYVNPGDVIFVNPGTVHAYGKGLTYFELQQTSDLTYRIFDWNRVDKSGKPRELHIAKALEVIDYDTVNLSKNWPMLVEEQYGRRYLLAACRHFLLEKLEVGKSLAAATLGSSFHLLCVIDGEAELICPCEAEARIGLGKGDTTLIPAAIPEYTVAPKPACVILRAYVPDLRVDVVDFLSGLGHSKEAIMRLAGGSASSNDIAQYFKGISHNISSG
jgi:mannose-6-phosphate isomerase